MRSIRILFLFPAVAVMSLAQEESAAKNELAFGLGGLPSFSRSDSPSLNAGPGVGFEVNYGRRFLERDKFALYGEVNFLASPLRDVSSSVNSATDNFASIYVTPGVRLKLFPKRRIAPYFAIGGGYADYEQSTTEINGQPNTASRELSRGVFDFGAGVDFHLWRWVALRGEARDFYTGSPNYNVPAISGGQNNLVASGAIVLRWH